MQVDNFLKKTNLKIQTTHCAPSLWPKDVKSNNRTETGNATLLKSTSFKYGQFFSL